MSCPPYIGRGNVIQFASYKAPKLIAWRRVDVFERYVAHSVAGKLKSIFMCPLRRTVARSTHSAAKAAFAETVQPNDYDTTLIHR